MKSIRILAALLAALMLTLAVAACGDDDDDDGGGGSDQPTATSSGESEVREITISDFTYDPDDFTISADTETAFKVSNSDDVSHTFTVYRDEEYTDPTDIDIQAGAGGSGEKTETLAAGEYYFRCELHPTQMQGEFEAE